eukprot:RCo010089
MSEYVLPTAFSGYLKYNHKISLYSEESGGYLAAAGLTSSDLRVEPLNTTGATPQNFERCVLSVRPVVIWESSSAPISDLGLATSNVTYGQVIQLYHPYTDTWVCVRKKLQSETEKNCFRMSLVRRAMVENDKSISFKILPRYKVRQEGEKVRLLDQVMLVPDGDDTRYVHTSCTPFPEGSFEVNCSFFASSWTVMLYDTAADRSEDASAIRAGEPVVLFHKEIEGFFAADPLNHIKQLEESATATATAASAGSP